VRRNVWKLNVDEVYGFTYDARAVRTTVIFAGSNLAKHEQDQQNNKHKAEGTAPVVASTVKRASADSTKAAQQCDHQDDENDGPD
jgi:hypothetical protein